ncbi:MAG: hypothetical protein HYY30_11565 [Chloroflexi bacterium]|nr:hypothetical protein [Chloroflexota bacterium]
MVPENKSPALLWPQMRIDANSLGDGKKLAIQVTDVAPWANVLVTVDGQPADMVDWSSVPGGTWTWKWAITPTKNSPASQAEDAAITFYHDCDTGCIERGRLTVGVRDRGPVVSPPRPATAVPTKLGVVFANPDRDWHGRGGWDVELTYTRLAEEDHWGIDDLAARVYGAASKGLRVLVRVDYDRGQSLPPADDYLAQTEYLRYVQRLARDDRLRAVYGYIIGSNFNALDSNSQAPDRPVSPAWYARLFNGYGEAASRTDNVVQTLRAQNPGVRVLVGPVRPWNRDQDGERGLIDVPWLNYMNSLVAAIDEGTRAKVAAGIPMAGPDGFAIQAAGRPDAVELAGRSGAEEPRLDLKRTAWDGAQAGFRIYQDWLDVINGHQTTHGLPVYITSANTFAPDDGTPPAQNYPRGWLTTALQTIDEEPQILALAWFEDGPLGDSQWEWFSLSRRSGRMIDAAEEFDVLLQGRH